MNNVPSGHNGVTGPTSIEALENVSGARLTNEIYQKCKSSTEEGIQLHRKGVLLANITMPELTEGLEPEILSDPIDTIPKSSAYPYGLSDRMNEKLHKATN